MAIKIHEKPAPVDEQSAHDEEAASIEDTITTTTTKSGEEEPLNEDVQHTSTPVNIAAPFERIEVGMAFKMPVASYTMLEFSVRRSFPFDPKKDNADAVFDTVHAWVEAKLNKLIEDQQTEA